jgi:hypothetical protein
VDWEIARGHTREMERALVEEIGEEGVRDIKRTMGKRLTLKTCVERIQRGEI